MPAGGRWASARAAAAGVRSNNARARRIQVGDEGRVLGQQRGESRLVGPEVRPRFERHFRQELPGQRVAGFDGQRALQGALAVAVPAHLQIAAAELLEQVEVARVERERPLHLAHRFLPLALPAQDVAVQLGDAGLVGQGAPRQRQLGGGTGVIAALVMIVGERQMGFARVGGQAHRPLHSGVELLQARGRVVRPVQAAVRARQQAPRAQELRVARERLLDQTDDLRHPLRALHGAAVAVKEVPGAQVQVVGGQIGGRRRVDGAFFLRRKPRLELPGDGQGDLALDGEHVVERAGQ